MRWSSLLLLALLPTQAHADLTATYVTSNTHRGTTVEIASNGDFRTDGGQLPHSFIVRGDEAYWIETKPNGPVVMRVNDILTVVTELTKAPQADGTRVTVADVPVVARKGSFTINGRVGDAYYAVEAGGRLSAQPLVVISHDPALAPLGHALARLLTLSQGMTGGTPDARNVAVLVAVLNGGAPILSPDGELQSINFAPIVASRFELPAPPLSLDEVRRALAQLTP